MRQCTGAQRPAIYDTVSDAQPFSIIAAFHCSPVLRTSSWVRHLGLHNFTLRANEQPHFPAELMGEDDRARFATILRDAKQIADLLRFAVSSETLQNFDHAWSFYRDVRVHDRRRVSS